MKSKSIREIKMLIDDNKINVHMLDEMKKDERKGVQRLLAIYEKQQAAKAKQLAHFKNMRRFDDQFRENESFLLAGVDEAGRGPLAGPVVAAAVILPADFMEIGLNDSKQISEQERKRLFDVITKQAISYAVSIIHHDEIDRLNILNATKKAMSTALTSLSVKPDLALIDAVELKPFGINTQAIIKGDEKSSAIAAASILAKVTRDEWMDHIDEKYPAYDFKHNKGYGTKIHLDALQTLGPSPFHRKTFSPVQKAIVNKGGL